MSTTTDRLSSSDFDSGLALPDPGERVPTLSWPIVGIFVVSLAVFGTATWAALIGALPAVITIAASAVAIFMMFTVLHDASHYSISSHRWVNAAFGRVAMILVSPLISFPSFAFIHIEHHRNTNDHESDPDHFVSAASYWQLPFRFPVMDIPYLACLFRNRRRRPRSEVVETVFLLIATTFLITAAGVAGHLWTLAIVYLIPSRVAMFVLAWWFDWLPHHDLDDTPADNRYRTTRNRVGSEWILTPLLLSQNYHLVHHLHPSIPFYRYVAAWRRNEDAYLERGVAIGTVLGQQLDPGEYREWKRLNGKRAALLPVHLVPATSRPRAGTFALVVQQVTPLTPDSVKITFDVPEDLADVFRFEAGQHLTVFHDVAGRRIRRNYSICAPAGSGDIAIGIRKVPGGQFSTFAVETLKAGDVLEVAPPSGKFGATADPAAIRDHVAVAAGSGITPIMSIIGTTLDLEPGSRFTLFCGNRTRESTMFAAELDELEARYDGRLRVVHIRSADPGHPAVLSGRIDAVLITRLLRREVTSIDQWYLCGPTELSVDVRSALIAAGVPVERVHLELFRGTERPSRADDHVESEVNVTLSGMEHQLTVRRGESVLEAALANNVDAPYSCLGGACGTCKAKVTSGAVRMEQNLALSPAEVDQGLVLTCQSYPTTPAVAVEYGRSQTRRDR